MKKGIFASFIFIVFAAFVFCLGLIPLRIPAEKTGVLSSRTGGVYPKVIKNGEFLWKWELLIPKNSNVCIFDQKTLSFTQNFSGELPSSSFYSSFIKGNPNFSYNIAFSISLKPEEDFLVSLVKSGEVSGQSELEHYLGQCAESICISLIRSDFLWKGDFFKDSAGLIKLAEQNGIFSKYPQITVTELYIKDISIPDMELYNLARESVKKFQIQVDENLLLEAKEQAEKILSDERSVKKLAKIGQMLKDFPELNSLLSNGNTAEVLKALNELK